jgi:hypothetical protein
MRSTFASPGPVVALILLLWLTGDPASAREAACRVVTLWNAGCSGGTRDSWDDMVVNWYDAITNALPVFGHGNQAYGRSGAKVNGTIVDSDFADDGTTYWGNDNGPGRPDAVDAFMVGLHGVEASPSLRWMGRVRVDESGVGNCNAFQTHIRIGDGDLEFMHISSCFSMDREDWWPAWSGSFHGAHQIDGFHGLMWIGPSRESEYSDFANDAFWTGIASAWIDNMYQPDIAGSDDQCPVARVVGINDADTVFRMSFERYNAVLSDPPGPGTTRAHRVRYVRGCDPRGKDAL